MARRKRPDEDEYSRHFVPKPADHPNETLRCRWCGTETEHTVSDFCGKKVKLCCECGEMRHKVADQWPRIRTPEELESYKAELAERVSRVKEERAAETEEMAKPSEPELYDPHDMVPEFGSWKIVRLCRSCSGMTVHVRSLEKVSYGYVFRCCECGRIVSAGMQ